MKRLILAVLMSLLIVECSMFTKVITKEKIIIDTLVFVDTLYKLDTVHHFIYDIDTIEFNTVDTLKIIDSVITFKEVIKVDTLEVIDTLIITDKNIVFLDSTEFEHLAKNWDETFIKTTYPVYYINNKFKGKNTILVKFGKVIYNIDRNYYFNLFTNHK